VQGQGI